MRGKLPAALVLCAAALLMGCEGIDCTLNNVVYCYYGFYDSGTGKQVSLTDTLTVTAEGTDSVLYNRGVNISSVQVPMSYWNETDTLVFLLYGEDHYYRNTFYVSKENIVHHETPDCPTTMFHQLMDVSFQSGIIDSVVISRPEVDYMQDENIKIYFRTNL